MLSTALSRRSAARFTKLLVSRLGIIYIYYLFTVTPIHELGHYLSATVLSIPIKSVKWFSWPWEIAAGIYPHVELAQEVAGATRVIVALSGVGLSLVFIAATLIAMKRLWDAAEWGLILIPLATSSAYFDIGEGTLGYAVFLLSTLLLVYMMNRVANRLRTSIAAEGQTGSENTVTASHQPNQ